MSRSGQLEIPDRDGDRAGVAGGAGRAGARTMLLNPAPATEPPILEALARGDRRDRSERARGPYSSAASKALLQHGVSTIIVTMGASGVEVTEARRGAGPPVVTRHPSISVDAIDTTGAGDSFCGALAARLAAGDTLDDAVRWAICAGRVGDDTARCRALLADGGRDQDLSRIAPAR